MTTKEKIIDIISYSGKMLSYVETTSSRTGYPENTSWAITGFEDYEEAEQFAKDNDLELIWLTKRDGWNLWFRADTYRGDKITIDDDTFGDNANVYDTLRELDDDRREILNALISDGADINAIERFVLDWRHGHDAMDGEGDNDVVAVWQEGVFDGVYTKHPAEFSYDSKTQILAAQLK
ncbi:MAG: hypothetical protein IJ767_04050 [Bacteroidaceae bacterium]|nr:hypothetical protein [Bacteroidaceae bacterium]